MPPRVTPLNALATVRQYCSDLTRCVVEAGSLSAAPHLLRQLEDLQRQLDAGVLLVELWIDDGGDPNSTAQWLLGVPSFEHVIGSSRVRLVPATSSSPLEFSAGKLAPSVLVWIRNGAETSVNPQAFEDRALIVVSGDEGVSPRDCICVNRNDSEGVLTRVLTSAPGVADLLQADSAARALDGCAAIANIAFAHEARGIRARRALAQQRAGAAQKPPVANTHEWFANLKARLQRMFAELVRGIDDRFQQDLGSPGAPFWSALEAQLETIVTLEREPRLKTVTTKLPADQEEAWLTLLDTAIRTHC